MAQGVYIVFTVLVILVPLMSTMDVRNGAGEIIRGLPCVKRLNQLSCSSGGSSYPAASISTFIDDNKALLRRMYGELQEPRTVTRTTVRVVRTFSGPTSFAVSAPLIQGHFASPPQNLGFTRFRRDVMEGTLEEMMENEGEAEPEPEPMRKKRGVDEEEEGQAEPEPEPMRRRRRGVMISQSNSTVVEDEGHSRPKRQADFPGTPDQNKGNKEDVCNSKVEIVTPFWASNSNGKVRAVLNNKEFEQAIHQEICTKSSTARCQRDCSCEQKYKWHRLLAYDPNNDCAGIFMDWFLFPSCCVCRCAKNPFLTK